MRETVIAEVCASYKRSIARCKVRVLAAWQCEDVKKRKQQLEVEVI